MDYFIRFVVDLMFIWDAVIQNWRVYCKLCVYIYVNVKVLFKNLRIFY